MGANNHKKFLSPAEVNHVQGLVKMRGHDSRSLAAVTGYARSAIIKVLNGDRCMPRARGAIAQVLGLPEAALFPGPAAAGAEPLPELGAPGGGQ